MNESAESYKKESKKKLTEIKFSRLQLLSSEQYHDSKDIVSVLVGENESCTLQEVDKRIKEFRKGKVN